MTNYHLLGQTKLAKMAEEYLTCFVRGDPCEQASSSCLVQIISTNPFEISDNSHHIRVRDPSHILEALKKVNANINLLSMKGALIMLKKWHIESQYFPLNNEVKLDVVIEEVEYIDGLGTSELVMDTVSILEIPNLKNKFRRLKKHLQAREFNDFHPIEETMDLLENQNFKNSEKIRKADLRLEKPIEPSLEGRVDPFLIWSHEQLLAGKSSVSKSNASQISDFEVLSINSQTQNKYNNVKLKASVPKRFAQSLPVNNNAFALDFNQLSNDPLIQKMQIDEDLDLPQFPQNPVAVEEAAEVAEISEKEVRDNQNGEATEIIDMTLSEERPSFIRDFIQKINSKEFADKDVQEEKETPGKQHLKRNFHDMIKSNTMPGLVEPQQELKKMKFQWGPNHKKEQQKFREALEGRRSFSKASPEGDILDLLASSQLAREPEENEVDEKNDNNVILLEEDERQGRIEEEKVVVARERSVERSVSPVSTVSPVRRGKDSGERAIDEVNEMITNQRRMSTPTLGPKKVANTKMNTMNNNNQQKKVETVQEPSRQENHSYKNNNQAKLVMLNPAKNLRESVAVVETKPVVTMREKPRPMSFGRPQQEVQAQGRKESFGSNHHQINNYYDEVREVREIRREKPIMNQMNQQGNQVKKTNRLDGYLMIGEKENNKSIRGKNYNGFVDLTRDVSPKEQYARNIHGGNNESNVFMNARRPESGAFSSIPMQKEVKKKTIVNPFDPTKSFDMSEFKDLSLKPKKQAATGDTSKNRNFPQKRNQTIEIL